MSSPLTTTSSVWGNDPDRLRYGPVVLSTRSGKLVAIAWLVALVAVGISAAISHGESAFAFDFRPVYDGAHGLVHFGDPYRPVAGDLSFVYPPSCALLFLPIVVLHPHVASDAGLVLAGISIVALACFAGLGARRFRGTGGAICLLALAIVPLGHNALTLGNLSILVSATVAAGCAVGSERPGIWTGLLFGLGLALKPLVAPALIIFLVWRTWKALATAIAVPVVLNLLALPFLGNPSDFVLKVLPKLLRGETLQLRYNASVSGFFERNGLPQWSGDAFRALIVIWLVAILIAASRRTPARGLPMALASASIIAVALVSTQDEAHYSLVAVPLLVAAAVDERALDRVLAVLALALIACADNATLVMFGQLTSLVVATLVVLNHERQTTTKLGDALAG